jgi:hypothetical protein
MGRMPDDVTERRFAELAAGACPAYVDLLLALGQEFGEVDGDAVRERLDDDSRALFGIDELSPLARADRLAAVMDRLVEVQPDRARRVLREEAELRLGEGSTEPPGEIRAACAHELAFCVLCGLSSAYAQLGRDDDARHAGRLRLALPVQPR